MNIEEIKSGLNPWWDRTMDMIHAALATDIDNLGKLNAMLLENSGKQLRPMLALLTASACGEVNEDSCRFAAAAELLHNATLLHDDVADKSDCRRGRPTVNALMGPSVSVLVGDYWLVKAVRCVLESERNGDKVTRIFAKTLSDLAEGELLQLQKADKCDTTEQDYLRIIYCKTASLFVATAESAAISTGASQEIIDAVRRFATDLGLAFQIKDDIFDYSVGMNVGKPVGADLLEHKITMPLLGAFASLGKAKEADVRARLSIGEVSDAEREEISTLVRENGGIEYAERRMDDFICSARKALYSLPESSSRDILEQVLAYVATRNH